MGEVLLKDDDDDDKSIWDSISRIMMLSVLKQTKSKVKFWFLKNYLSPSFEMAVEYGFEYELVLYKWPRWLNQQKEKQDHVGESWQLSTRIHPVLNHLLCNRYKILFLDVLFPLDVKKFTFVDADQVVGTDLQELNDLDLEGAPYGYTPFCSSRTEMDGFRFWKSGYWALHLTSRQYHISGDTKGKNVHSNRRWAVANPGSWNLFVLNALYVVDLKRFRRIAAGGQT